nr:PilT/PilU family type 4a pilus ATPase [Candidatus Gracilibacteria bacterium]
MENVIKPDHKLKDQLLQVMIDNEGSDMYITVGTFPAIKIGGEILRIDEGIEILTWKDTLEFAQSLITEKQHTDLVKTRNLDFAFSYNSRRFRGNVSFQMGNYMVVLRLLSSNIPSLDNLGLTDIYKDMTKLGQGLILITGPTGSGKSTTMASMINHINENLNRHIITIEDPIEYVHEHKRSIIEQKEIGKDVPSYASALMGAMRQNPHVILFGEMRTREEIEMGLTLAETGHLVFSSLHTRNAYQTITRIIDSFDGPEQTQIRLQLAESLVAVFSQRLLKKTDGTGVVMAKEILVKNSAVANLIRENDLHQIPSVIQMGGKDGMQLLEKDLLGFIGRGEITMDEGLRYANNPKLLKEL